MVGAPVPYVRARIYPTAQQLAHWSVVWDDQTAWGPCPRCDDLLNFSWQSELVEMGDAAEEESVSRKVDCLCGIEHPGSEQTEPSCGAFWYAAFHPPGSGPQVTAQSDAKVIAATDAFQKAVGEQESRLRGAAEKWVAGIASLLALFGIAGTVTGGKIIDGLPNTAKIAVPVLALLAVVFAIIATVASYMAAYGWPRRISLVDDRAMVGWYDARQSRLSAAAKQMRTAVIAAVASICLLVAAAGVVWFNPAQAPQPMLKITFDDGSARCGLILVSKPNGQLRLRTAVGSVSTITIANAVRVEAVKAC